MASGLFSWPALSMESVASVCSAVEKVAVAEARARDFGKTSGDREDNGF